MNRIAVVLILISGAFVLGYFMGASQTKAKISEKKAEIIKNESQKRALIQAEPNASRTDLLKLMRSGKL